MRLAALAALLLAGPLLTSGCDAATEDAGPSGSFSVEVTGGLTASPAGTATFLLAPCRELQFSGIETRTSLSLLPSCEQDANGAFSDELRRGTFPVATDQQRAGAIVLIFVEPEARRPYRATAGTVEITGESQDRVTGRINVEARAYGAGGVDTSVPAIRIVGTFDARGIAGGN